MLKIEKQLTDKALCLSLEGRLDSQTSQQLETEMMVALPGVEELTFDMKGLEYISSAGLRVLLVAMKAMAKQGKMKLVNVGETVRDILDVTGFSDILTIE
ncbi:MAG: STAS domain-containing protein [Erysipelotrichaceae bacterium]|nr:STAS domain-containing protein [Erysipelotrichaceae bacterium]